jgi:predicted RNase H-like nuclease (RuvC/YqgF family)
MNSKSVLNKIITLLSDEKKDVKLAFAELADGTVLESPTFDVGESVEVVAEDGSKSPAPNGEHELVLRDEEGNEERFKIFVEDGVIRERENIELEEETEEVEKLPETEMSSETELSDAEEIKEEVDVDVVSLEEVNKVVEEMSYRIDELEKKIAEMEKVEEELEEKIEEEKEEVELSSVPTLNGAPLATKPIGNTRRTASPQAAFLKKLYN